MVGAVADIPIGCGRHLMDFPDEMYYRLERETGIITSYSVERLQPEQFNCGQPASIDHTHIRYCERCAKRAGLAW